MKAELKDLYMYKSNLWNLKLIDLKNNKTSDWTEKELDVVLNGLSRNKTRDPHGLVYELFKPEVMGRQMKYSLLKLLNIIKQ